MTNLTAQIESDLTTALKTREQEKLDALRLVRAALKNEQISLGHELVDEEVQKVLSRLIKQRKEAADHYRAGGRAESALKEEREAKLIQAYVPTQLADAELEAIVRETITEIDASGSRDFGKVMSQVMAKTKGQADGNRVATLVRSELG